jgi:hypothetical protein
MLLESNRVTVTVEESGAYGENSDGCGAFRVMAKVFKPDLSAPVPVPTPSDNMCAMLLESNSYGGRE